jgi:hypothetical protein
MKEALCQGREDVEWFPESRNATLRVPPEVPELCGKCPVGRDCFEFAINAPREAGIWGGHLFFSSGAYLKIPVDGVIPTSGRKSALRRVRSYWWRYEDLEESEG